MAAGGALVTSFSMAGKEYDAGCPYLLADGFSEAMGSCTVAVRNHTTLNVQRRLALHAQRDCNVDDAGVRLCLARELLKLRGETTTAVDVLLDANSESTQFAQLATLAVAVAASLGPQKKSLFTSAAKRAAALLLAKGDVDAAVEKYLLAGDEAEACVALQSRGRWQEAALAAQLTSMSASARADVVQPWAQHCAKHGDEFAAARLLLSLGLVKDALVVLAESAHHTDVTGQLALAVARAYPQLRKDLRQTPQGETAVAAESSGSTSLATVVQGLLGDYSNVLNSVGHLSGERFVLGEMTQLKRAMRQAREDDER